MTDKPNLTRVWAKTAPGGNVVDPDTVTAGKYAAGWQAEVPPFEYFNFIQKQTTQGLAHINEQGIAVWDDLTNYPISALAKGSDGNVYKALVSQNNNNPVSDDGTNWVDELNNRVIRVTSIAAMLSISPAAGIQISAANYHGDYEGGGGVFYWESTKDKADHNGGSVIDPSVTYPAEWNNQTQLGTWFTAGTGAGCWVRVFYGAPYVTMFGARGDITTNNTLSFNAAKDAHSNIRVPLGEFMLDGLVFDTTGQSMCGESYETTRLLINPSITSGDFIRVAKTNYTRGVELRDFSIDGVNDGNTFSAQDALVGLSIGESITLAATRNIFENIYINKVNIGIKAFYAWTNNFNHIQVANCRLGIKLVAQVNNCNFINTRFVNCFKHLEISNCEAVVFTTPLFQNSPAAAGQGKIITTVQSGLTLMSPYFESISADGIATIGIPGESSTTPSYLIIIGGELNATAEESFIEIGGPHVSVRVEGLREQLGSPLYIGALLAKDTTADTLRGPLKSNSQLYSFGQEKVPFKKVFSLKNNNKDTLIRQGGGNTITTFPTPNNEIGISVSVTFGGFFLGYVCEDTKLYTLVIRGRSGNATRPAFRIPRVLFATDLLWEEGSDYETSYFTFRMNETAEPYFTLTEIGIPVYVQQMDLYEGCFLQPTEVEVHTEQYGDTAPTVESWLIGDIVYSKSPAASGTIGWVCTASGTPGTWKTFGNIGA